ncbi:unnamed protein product, partial [marine sediment metagenome]
ISDDDFFLQMSSGLVAVYKHQHANPDTSESRKKTNAEILALHKALKGLGQSAQSLVSIRYFGAQLELSGGAAPPKPIEAHIGWMLQASNVKVTAMESIRKSMASRAATQLQRLGIPLDPSTGS